MDDLIAAIVDVREKLGRGLFTSEDQVSKGVVMRLLQALGWDVFDPARVSSEFRIKNRKVDYALQYNPFGPIVLIEVKDVGKATPQGEEQLFDYCAKQGVPLAVLTDGQIWNFYLPAGMGSYEQRRFAVGNVLEDEAECARVLRRYLGFEAVTSGRSHRDAQADYDAHRQQILAEQEFVRVFDALVTEADHRFVALFCDEVESRTQIRPDEIRVLGYLRTRTGQRTERKRSDGERLRQPRPSADERPRGTGPRRASPRKVPAYDSRSASFTWFGKTVSCKNDTEVLVGVMKALGERDPAVYGRCAPHLEGRRRRFLAKDRNRLYPPGSPVSVLKSVARLSGGWWLGTHSSTAQKNKQLVKARELAEVPARDCHWQMKGAI